MNTPLPSSRNLLLSILASGRSVLLIASVLCLANSLYAVTLPVSAPVKANIHNASAAAPVITSFSPSKGAVGTVVTITGTDLGSPSGFTIGGVNAIIVSNNGTQLVGMVMPGAVTGAISVTTTDGTATSSTNFTVTPTLHPVAQQGPILTSSDFSTYSSFGYSVAISADGSTAIVGGYADNNNTGGAAIFTLNNGVWVQQGAKLLPNDNAGNAGFGSSVSLSADGNTALIGGYSDNNSVGAAWVFTRNNNTWTQQGGKLSSPSGFALFGCSASISADGNTAVIGAEYANNFTGSAFIFVRSNNSWAQQGNGLSPTESLSFSSLFGASVSISADGNKVIVGAFDDGGGLGAAWVFARNNQTWAQQSAKIVPSDAIGIAYFGYGVAMAADGNTAIIGGPIDDGDAGAAWIYTFAGNTWTQQAKLTGSNNVIAVMGDAVAISADGNTAIAGGQNDNNGTGALWAYTRNNNTWNQAGPKFLPTGGIGTSYFGSAVTLTPNGQTALAGGPQNNQSGGVWAFTGAQAPSSDASLSSLSLPSVTLAPLFGAAALVYTASVPNTTKTITLTPTTTDATASIKINGTTVASGAASAPIALSVGDNIVNTIITAADGTVLTYQTTITRAPSAIATLANLTASSVSLSPVFSTGNLPYTDSVYYITSHTIITPTVTDTTATVTINGVNVALHATSDVALNVGDNIITILVTAQDGTTTQAYTITVTRATPKPQISYASNNQHYPTGTAITPLLPTNVGGPILGNPSYVVSTFAGSGAFGSADGTGTSATFSGPSGVTTDASGNVYVADNYNNMIRKITPAGVVTTIAGNGQQGATNGTGNGASFNRPTSLALASGFIYVVDQYSNLIRKVTHAGVVTTFAGNGTAGLANGNGIAASFNLPYGITADAAGNVYVADQGNHLIRKITPAGDVSTFAGTGTAGDADGTGTSASFNRPAGLAIDTAGNILVADQYNNQIRKITPAGVVTTVAGTGIYGTTDGTAATAKFGYPYGVATDAAGTIYVADGNSNNLIRQISTLGVVTTIAGSGTAGKTNGTGVAASFTYPNGIATDAAGNIYIADMGNNLIRKISSSMGYTIMPALADSLQFDPLTGIISGKPTAVSPPTVYTIKGFNAWGSSTTYVTIGASAPLPALPVINYPNPPVYAAGTAIAPLMPASTGGAVVGYVISPALPAGLAFDPLTGIISGTPQSAGSLTTYQIIASNATGKDTATVAFSIQGGAIIIIINPIVNGPIITYAGPTSFVSGTPITPLLPTNVGTPVVAAAPGIVSTLAGNGTFGAVNGTGTSASFSGPMGLTTDAAGNIYVADDYNNMIRKITPAGVVSSVAGNGSAGSTNGAGIAASFNRPTGVAADAAGNIYVADQYNNTIRKITPAGVVSVLAGSGTAGHDDGNGLAASFNLPYGVAADAAGNVYVADQGNNLIRKISATGDVITIAGSGAAGNTNATGTAATFNRPAAVAVDAAGNVYVADQYNNLIRKISTTGVVTTIAGSGNYGAANGNGLAATFGYPYGLAIDAAGTIYVADGNSNNLIRAINSVGDVTTMAGSGAAGADDGAAATATFKYPYGVAVDHTGNVFVGDMGNNLIRKISSSVGGYTISPALPAGLVFDPATGTISGTPAAGMPPTTFTITAYNSNGSGSTTVTIDVTVPVVPAAAAPLVAYTAPQPYPVNAPIAPLNPVSTGGVVDKYHISPALPAGLSIDSLSGVISGTPTAGSVATSYTVTANNTGGTITTTVSITITTPPTPIMILQAAPAIAYMGPQSYTAGLAITPLLPANTGGAVAPGTPGMVSTYAGTGSFGAINGAAATATFSGPAGIATDAAGNVYVTDQYNNMIRKISASGVVSTLAGNGQQGAINGAGAAASFNRPTGVVADANGNVYVTDQYSNQIRKITPGGLVTTLAGSTTSGSADGDGIAASFNLPYGLAIDASGNIFVADQGNNLIRKITPGGTVTTFAGSGAAGNSNGTGIAASFNRPAAIVIDAAGNLFVTDQYNNQIRKITPAGLVSTFAGTGLYGAANGSATTATFGYPYGITVDVAGNLYVADGNSNNLIRQITPSGTVSTLAGTGAAGNDNGAGTVATFKYPYGIAADAAGNLYVGDMANNQVRMITSSLGYTISPALPAGLVFDPLTGTISGTPVAGISSPLTTYTIKAYNTGGFTSTTIDIAVTVPLTFAAIPAKTYGAADFGTGAVSDAPVSYTSSNSAVATVVAGNIHIVGAGPTTITANNGSFTLSQTFVVNKASLIIIANNQLKAEGAVNPVLTASYTGFVNGDTYASLTTQPLITTTATTSSVIGSYRIRVAGAASNNYSISYVLGTLTVTTSAAASMFNANSGVQPVVKQFISPNGDGINDVLIVTDIDQFTDNKLTLLNANQVVIYEQTGYNNLDKVFDGHANVAGNSTLQTPGTYYYMLDYKDNGTPKHTAGFFIIKY